VPSIAPASQLFSELVGAAEEAAADAHGEEVLDLAAGGQVWRHDPVDFEAFCYAPEHLNLPRLFPRQLNAVYALIGRDPKRVFEHVDQQAEDETARRYQLAVLLWGKGSGKDYLCSVLVLYLVYVLLCLQNPQAYFELAPGENIDVVNVAYSADQAKKVFFAKFKQRLYRWRWLRENFDAIEGGRRKWKSNVGLPKVEINDQDVIFPRQIRCFSRHSANESYEGLNIIAWIMDEASAFLSAAKRENADAIYQTLRTSAGSRFGLRWVGLVISYPRHADDFTCTKVREAIANPDAGIYGDGPAATWEVNQLLGRREWVEVRPGVRVPVELANDFVLDFEEARAKYMAMPPLAKDALIKDPDRVWAAVQQGRAPLIEWEPTITRRTVVDGEGNERVREFAAVKLTKLGALPKRTKVFFHGDPARSSDGFALGFAHGVPATIELWVPAGEVLTAEQMARTGVRPDTPVRWERDVVRTVVDALIVWRPDPNANRHVDQLNVREILKQLVETYRIGGGSFDHYDSAELVQWLEARKLPVENEQWSNPFQHRIYRGARSAFYNDLVTLPDTPSITSEDRRQPGAIFELVRVEEIEGHKIDHPEGGSKDCADVVARLIEHVTGQAMTGFAFGSATGGSGTLARVPLPGRRTDPSRTSSPATPVRREREAQRQAERPAGVIHQGAGTIEPAPPPTTTGRGGFSFGNASR
jgi:hypothetical protein